jgi:hypothetical protein
VAHHQRVVGPKRRPRDRGEPPQQRLVGHDLLLEEQIGPGAGRGGPDDPAAEPLQLGRGGPEVLAAFEHWWTSGTQPFPKCAQRPVSTFVFSSSVEWSVAHDQVLPDETLDGSVALSDPK